MEDNKLIAEFMGLELEETLEGLFVYARIEQSPIKLNDIKTEFYEVHELQYHSSWDWLRPVLVKIDTYANSDSLSIAEYEDYRNKYFLIAEGSIYDEILDTHKQVVEFIKSIQLPF